MQKFSAAAFEALTAEECDQLLASVRDGARFRVFSFGAGEIFDRDPDLLGRRVYLVQPGEWLIPQKLWYTLSAAIDGILWTAFAHSEFATLSPLARVVVCSIFILPYAHLTAVTMQGGRDVTDAAIFQLRRKLHGFAEAEDTRDFFDDLSQRPSPVSENNGKPL